MRWWLKSRFLIVFILVVVVSVSTLYLLTCFTALQTKTMIYHPTVIIMMNAITQPWLAESYIFLNIVEQ